MKYFLVCVLIIMSYFAREVNAENSCSKDIGVILPLTGNAALIGDYARKGIELAQEQINLAHPQCSLKVIFEDSAFDVSKGLNAFQLLNTRKDLKGIITGATHISLAIQPLSNKNNIPQFAIFTSSKKYSTPDDLSFRISNITTDETKPLFDFTQSKGFKKIGVLYIDNEFGVGISSEYARMVNENHQKILYEEAFSPQQTDFKTILLKMKDLQIESILIVGLTIHMKQILKQAEDINFSPYFLAGRSAQDQSLFSEPSMTDKFFFSDLLNLESKDPITAKFVEDFVLKYAINPVSYAAEGYQATLLINEILTSCGDSKECFKEKMKNPNGYPSVFGTLTFNTFGDAAFKCHLRHVSEGKSFFYSG